jgi:dihydroflavonol-4-reductase
MVVVTGATGHLGNVLVRELLARGQDVRVLMLPLENVRPLAGLDVEPVAGDVRDRNSLIKAFAGASYVYHVAGLISISPGQNKALHAVNVLGTRNVVDACLECGVKRLVYTSSVHALVEAPHGTAITETAGCDPARTIGPYAQSKALATHEVLRGVERGLDAVIVFPSGIVGPYDFAPSEMGQMMLDFMGRKLPAYIDGAYDFVDVRDVAAGILRAGEGGRTGEGYILSGEIVTVKRLMTLLHELTEIRAPSIKLPRWMAASAAVFAPWYYRLAGTRPRLTRYSVYVLGSNCQFDCGKARQEFDYTSRNIIATIADSIEWFRQNEAL